MKRFSEMSQEELVKEIERIDEAIGHARLEGERDVLRQKRMLARSYAVKEKTFPQGQYRVEGEERVFRLQYVKGVYGWGTWENGEEAAVPLAALQPWS